MTTGPRESWGFDVLTENVDMNGKVLTILAIGGDFFLYLTKSGNLTEIAKSRSAKVLARYAFSNGADMVRYEFDLRMDEPYGA
jgi:hypothetical protein